MKLFGKQASFNSAALFVSAIGPIICTMIAGKYYGSSGIAITAICSPLFFLAGFFGFTISGGAVILSSKAIARDELDEVNQIYSASITLSVLIGIVLCIALLLFRKPILSLLAAGSVNLDIDNYYTCFILYTFSTILLYIPLNFARVTGRNEIGVLLTITMSAVSIAAIFILNSFMGIEAIALAQAIGSLSATILCTVLLWKNIRFVLPRKLYVLQIAAVGSPLGLSRLYSFINIFVLNRLFLGMGGESTLAVYGVISTLNRFTTSVTVGISQTIVPLIGVFHEERDNTSAKQLTKFSFTYGNIVMTAICILLIVFRASLTSLFGLTANVLYLPLILNGTFLLISMNNAFLTAFYNASGQLLLANMIPFAQDFALLLPLAFTLQQVENGVWFAQPLAALAATFLLALTLIFMRFKNHDLSFPFLYDRQREKKAKNISFSVDNEPAKASEAAQKITEFCEENCLSPKQTLLISMSIEEMLMLIINQCDNHGYFAISVRLFLLDGTMILRIRNAGVPFDPIEYYKQNISSDIEKSIDIIGLKYVVQSAAAIYYRQTFGVNNLVIII